MAETATKHTFSNAYLNQCLANALILLSLCNLEERNLLYHLTPNWANPKRCTSHCASTGHNSRKLPHLQWKSAFTCCPGCYVCLLEVKQVSLYKPHGVCRDDLLDILPRQTKPNQNKKYRGEWNILTEMWFLSEDFPDFWPKTCQIFTLYWFFF